MAHRKVRSWLDAEKARRDADTPCPYGERESESDDVSLMRDLDPDDTSLLQALTFVPTSQGLISNGSMSVN